MDPWNQISVFSQISQSDCIWSVGEEQKEGELLFIGDLSTVDYSISYLNPPPYLVQLPQIPLEFSLSRPEKSNYLDKADKFSPTGNQ